MVKLLIVTGYLGSGKTTLLRGLQDYLPKKKCHFIVNEAGEVALDQESYEMVRDATTVVSGGCACCIKKEQLLESLKKILDDQTNNGKNSVDYIVVETSGLANPAPIIFSIRSDQYLKHHIDVMGVICVVGAVEGEEALAHYDEVGQQLAMADAVIVSKAELVAAEYLEILRGRVSDIVVHCPIYVAQNGSANWSDIIAGLGGDRRSGRSKYGVTRNVGGLTSVADSKPRSPGNTNQHAGMSTCVLRVEGSLDWVAFGVWLSALLATHGESIVRVKGVIRVFDWDGHHFFVLINGVQHIIYPPRHVELAELPEEVALIFIMRNVNSDQVVDSLKKFYHDYCDDECAVIWAE